MKTALQLASPPTPEEERRAMRRAREKRRPKRVRNSPGTLAYQKAYRTAHRAETSARQKTWHAAHPEKRIAYYRKVQYGLTSNAFAALLTAQGGRCAICSTTFSDDLRPRVDHDHMTDAVRGLLCNRCNVGLGNFSDSVETLSVAVDYLRKASFTS